jgi:aryl-alcohol dehydrogenase-like predicted oxidoreductase
VRYRKFGTTGLDVSPLCLGCMSFGVPDRGTHPWSLSEEASRPLIQAAVEAGINFFDTANVYSDGTSEEIVGRALADFARRDEIVLATKVHGRMRPGPNGGGLSRKAILTEIDNSLRRLGTDYVDLYQIHRFGSTLYLDADREIVARVAAVAAARGVPRARVALAWLLSKDVVTAPIVGITKAAHLDDALAALDLELTDEEIASLEEPYTPHPVVGF